MTDKKVDLADVINAIADSTDAGLSGLLALTAILHSKGIIDQTDLKSIADAITSKLHREQQPVAFDLFERLIPGYQPHPRR